MKFAVSMKGSSHASIEPRRFDMALYRSRKYKIIGGVCGGLAEWLGWDPTLVRIAYIIGSLLSVAFPGLLVYIILWLLMPKNPVTY